jgi:hypothetical protein
MNLDKLKQDFIEKAIKNLNNKINYTTDFSKLLDYHSNQNYMNFNFKDYCLFLNPESYNYIKSFNLIKYYDKHNEVYFKLYNKLVNIFNTVYKYDKIHFRRLSRYEKFNSYYHQYENVLIINNTNIDYNGLIEKELISKISLISLPYYFFPYDKYQELDAKLKQLGFRNYNGFLPTLETTVENNELINYLNTLLLKPIEQTYDFIHLFISAYGYSIFKYQVSQIRLFNLFLSLGISLKFLKKNGTIILEDYYTCNTQLINKLYSLLQVLFKKIQIIAELGHFIIELREFKHNDSIINPNIIANEFIELGIKYYGFTLYDTHDILSHILKHPNQFYDISEFKESNEGKSYNPTTIYLITDIQFSPIVNNASKLLSKTEELLINFIIATLNTELHKSYRDKYIELSKYSQLTDKDEKLEFVKTTLMNKTINDINNYIQFGVILDKTLINFIFDHQYNTLLQLYKFRNLLQTQLTSLSSRLSVYLTTKKTMKTTREKITFKIPELDKSLELLNDSYIIKERNIAYYYPNIKKSVSRRQQFNNIVNIGTNLASYLNSVHFQKTIITENYLILWELFNKYYTYIYDSIFSKNTRKNLNPAFNILNLSIDKNKDWEHCNYNYINSVKPSYDIKQILYFINSSSDIISFPKILKISENANINKVELITSNIINFKDNQNQNINENIVNYNKTLLEIQKLEIAQLLLIISSLSQNGCCIVKNYGLVSKNSKYNKLETGYICSLIYTYHQYFNKIFIVKPSISDSSNSGYYLVCIGFQELENKFLEIEKISLFLNQFQANQCLISRNKMNKEIFNKIILSLNEIFELNYKYIDIINSIMGCEIYKNTEYNKQLNCKAITKEPETYQLKIFNQWLDENKFNFIINT